MKFWTRTTKFDGDCSALADRHYSRRTVGSPQFMPPGQTIVLKSPGAVFGWWRPHPSSGIKALNGLDGWTCTIFRRETGAVATASALILDAESVFAELGLDVWPDHLLTYVWDRKVKSENPGFCFKCAGWEAIGRSADGRKSLLQKKPPFGILKTELKENIMDLVKLVTAATDYFTAGAEYYKRVGNMVVIGAPSDEPKPKKTRAPKEPATPATPPAAEPAGVLTGVRAHIQPEAIDPKKAEAAANDAAKRLMQRFAAKMPDGRPEGFHKAIGILKDKFNVGALAELSPEKKLEFVAACDAIQVEAQPAAAQPSLTV